MGHDSILEALTANLPVREASKPVPNIKTAHPSAMEAYASKVKGHTSPNNSRRGKQVKGRYQGFNGSSRQVSEEKFNQGKRRPSYLIRINGRSIQKEAGLCLNGRKVR